jgi:hypothetical protein
VGKKKLYLSLREAHMQALTASPHAANGQSAQQPAQQRQHQQKQQQQPTVGVLNSQINS